MVSYMSGAYKRKVEETDFGGEGQRPFVPAGGWRPTKMCTFFQQGKCTKGPDCTFAHSEEELRPGSFGAEPQVVAPKAPAYLEFEGEGDDQAAEEHRDLEEELAEDLEPLLLDENNNESVFDDQAEEVEEDALAGAGPREFDGGVPKMLCRLWLLHPMYCQAGDMCLNAHGLAEMGINGKSAVIRCGSGTTATVSVADDAPTYPKAGGGKGPSSTPTYSSGVAKGSAKGSSAKGGDQWGPPAKGGDQWGPPAKGGEQKGSKGAWGASAKGAWSPPSWSSGYGKGSKGGPPAAFAALPAPGDAGGVNRFGNTNFKPTKLCNFWLQDPSKCQKGNDCTFAHSVAELQEGHASTAMAESGISRFQANGQRPPSKMCTFFLNNACTKAASCTFAHDESELASGFGGKGGGSW